MLQGRSFDAALIAIGLAALLLPATGAGAGATETQARGPVVVELYTSQGCSSCPAADALLGQLGAQKGVLAMTLPVTYWDMLGWRDTLATEANTERQKAYARQLGRMGVFTPEMIVDGVTDLVGSREPAVQTAISARAADTQSVPIRIAGDSQEIHLTVGAAPDRAREATIWLFGVLPQASVSVRGGENGGRNLNYRNVVRQIRAVGTWKGQPLAVTVPRSAAGAPHEGVAVLLQQGGYGRVIGAAWIERPDFSPLR
jgi:hypothetical protein